MRNKIIFILFPLFVAAFIYLNPFSFTNALQTESQVTTKVLDVPKVVYSKSSSFGLIEVITTYDPDLLSLCENKDYSLVHSTFSKTDTVKLDSEYEQFATVSFCFNQNIKDVLLLGLGAGEFLGYMKSYLHNTVIDVVEINPAIISVVQEFRKLTPKNTKFICADAFKYVADTDKKYDLIFGDIYFFKPNMIDDYRGYFTRVKARLNKGGVFVMNAYIPFIPRAVIRDMFANFTNVAAFVTSDSHNIVFICYQDAFKPMGELMLAAKEMQNKYHFRYPLSELVTKVVGISKTDAAAWINKFPELK